MECSANRKPNRKRLLGFLIVDVALSSDGEANKTGLRARGGHIENPEPVPAPVPHWKQRKARPATIQALDALPETLPEREPPKC